MRHLFSFSAASGRRTLAAVTVAVALAGCSDNTGLGVNLVSSSQVEQMGLQTWQAIRSETPASNNAAMKQTAAQVSQRILQASGQQPAQWEVVVFQGDEVNAFALPGGKIGVYEGMFRVADTPDQLAAVIGHEIAHVEAAHSAERVNTQVATELGAQLVSVALGATGVAPPETIAQLVGAGAHYGVALPYSRNQELEADRLGLTYMARAGYDPSAAVELWREMSQTGQRPPAFLSTHPDPERRVEDLQALLPEAMEIYRANR